MRLPKTLYKAVVNSIKNELLETSGYAAYTVFVAFFPFVILLISFASQFGQTAEVQQLIIDLQSYLPNEVNEVLMPVLQSFFDGPARPIVTFSVLGTLWVSSTGMESIRLGLNRAYERKETRSIFWRVAQSLFLILCLIALITTLSFLLVFIPLLETYFPVTKEEIPLVGWANSLLIAFHFAEWVDALIFLAFMTGGFAAAYAFLPNHKARLSAILPGACLAAVMCVCFSNAFSHYIQHVTTYSTIYKALGGIVILMLFIHFSIYFFMLGAQFNRELMRKGQ